MAATQTLLPPALVSIEEYLNTSYHPDVDFVDGVIEHRRPPEGEYTARETEELFVGEYEHNKLQLWIGSWLLAHEKEWGIDVVPEQRTHVSPDRIRVCDVSVLKAGSPRERVTTTPPLLCIEILSPEDRVARAKRVLEDYRRMGVPHTWLIDPIKRKAWKYDGTVLHEASTKRLEAEGTSIYVLLDDLFSRLDLSMSHTSQTRRPTYSVDQAVAALSAADLKLARLIERAGPFTMKLASKQSPFEALLESIIYQQLHGKAAATIHARLLASFAEPAAPNSTVAVAPHPTAQHLLEAPNEQLRAAGLSHNKALAVRDLAAKTLDGTVPTLARIRRMPDAEIIEHLTQVRGIGEWTVQMFLIFRLGRPDILPTNDYGVRKGFALTFGKLKPADKVTPADLPKPAEMEKRAKKWHPWCSVASWYLWRACDLAAKAPAP